MRAIVGPRGWGIAALERAHRRLHRGLLARRAGGDVFCSRSVRGLLRVQLAAALVVFLFSSSTRPSDATVWSGWVATPPMAPRWMMGWWWSMLLIANSSPGHRWPRPTMPRARTASREAPRPHYPMKQWRQGARPDGDAACGPYTSSERGGWQKKQTRIRRTEAYLAPGPR